MFDSNLQQTNPPVLRPTNLFRCFLIETVFLMFGCVVFISRMVVSAADVTQHKTPSPHDINWMLGKAKIITEPYQRRALKLLLCEVNQVACCLELPESMPITESNLTAFFILPEQGHRLWNAVGKIETRGYAYYVSKENKFCYLERMHQEADLRRWQKDYFWPIETMDTNSAYQLATNWLAALSIDVRALDRDCQVHIRALTPQGQTHGARFLPLYMVYWVNDNESYGSLASVGLFLPTRTLTQIRIENPKYNLRNPLMTAEP